MGDPTPGNDILKELPEDYTSQAAPADVIVVRQKGLMQNLENIGLHQLPDREKNPVLDLSCNEESVLSSAESQSVDSDRCKIQSVRGTFGMACFYEDGIAAGIERRSSNEPQDAYEYSNHFHLYNDENPLTIYDKTKKWFTCSNILFLMAGSPGAARNMKKYVLQTYPKTKPIRKKRKRTESNDGVLTHDIINVQDAVSTVKDYMNQLRGTKIKLNVIVAGWNSLEKELEIHTLIIDEEDKLQHTANPLGMIGHGTMEGGLDEFDKRMGTTDETRNTYNKNLSEDEISDVILKCLLETTSRDKSCGGGFFVFKLKRDGHKVELIQKTTFLDNCISHFPEPDVHGNTLVAFTDSPRYGEVLRGHLLDFFPGSKNAHRIAHLRKKDQSRGFYLHRLAFQTEPLGFEAYYEMAQPHKGKSERQLHTLFPRRVRMEMKDHGRPESEKDKKHKVWLYLAEYSKELVKSLKNTCTEMHPKNYIVKQLKLDGI